MGYLTGFSQGYGAGYQDVVMTSPPFDPAFPDRQVWVDSTPGRDYTPVHFTTTAARDAYVLQLEAAHTGVQRKAVIDKYVRHAHGGYWGTVGEAL